MNSNQLPISKGDPADSKGKVSTIRNQTTVPLMKNFYADPRSVILIHIKLARITGPLQLYQNETSKEWPEGIRDEQ